MWILSFFHIRLSFNQRINIWKECLMMSGDDSEESMHKRLKEELEEFEKEYASKDWTILEEDE